MTRDPTSPTPKETSRRTIPIKSRRFVIWGTICVLTSGLLATIPGFDALAYFFCLVIAPLLSVACSHLAVSHAHHTKHLPGGSGHPYWRALGESLVVSLVLALLPLVVISANVLRVPVCDYGSGLLFYVVGPVLSAAFGAALGHSMGYIFLTRFWAMWAVSGVIVLSFAVLALHFYYHPSIFAYSPYIGFISGAIYDDVIQIGQTFLLYRINNLAQAMAILFGANVLYLLKQHADGTSGTTGIARVPWLQGSIAAFAVVASLLFFWGRGFVGYEITRDQIESELGGVYESEHFVLHFPAGNSWFRNNIAILAEDHEFRFSQLSQELATIVPYKIHSYLYATNSQKRRLMGADKVQIAKPWLGEIHLTKPDYGAEVVKHELAHIFAANFASGPLRIPAFLGFLPHMGLVEGLAVAVESSRGRLSLHQWSATLMKLDKLPNIASVLGPAGYFSTYGATAYTTAGSFLRFLIDQYGIESVQRVYNSGDFNGAFGKSLETLTSQWTEWISDPNRVPISPDDLERSRFIFDRKPVLGRVCPLVIARMERDAEFLKKRRDYEESLTTWQKITSHNPQAPEKRFPKIDLLIRLNRFDDARQVAESILADPQSSAILRTRTELAIADLDWTTGALDSAMTTINRLLSAPLSEDELRAIEVRHLTLQNADPTIRRGIADYLLGRLPADEARGSLWAAVAKHPTEPLLAYLVGKYLFTEQRYLSAATVLTAVAHNRELTPRIRRETERCLGEAWYHLGVYDSATHHFQQAADHTPPLAYGMLATLEDWQERVRWKKSQTPLTAVK